MQRNGHAEQRCACKAKVAGEENDARSAKRGVKVLMPLPFLPPVSRNQRSDFEQLQGGSFNAQKCRDLPLCTAALSHTVLAWF